MWTTIFEVGVVLALAWFIWRLWSQVLFGMRRCEEPGDLASNPARLRPRPKSGAAAIALAEPDEDEEEGDDPYPPQARSQRWR